VPFLTLLPARSRQLNDNPFGTRGKAISIPFLDVDQANRAP
jgi:hypothetical protein